MFRGNTTSQCVMVSLLCSQQLVQQDLNNNINLRLSIHIQNDKLKSIKLIIIWKDEWQLVISCLLQSQLVGGLVL